MSSRSHRTRTVLTFGVCLVLLAGVHALSYLSQRDLIRSIEWVSHTRDVEREIDRLLVNLERAQTEVTAYQITSDPGYVQSFGERMVMADEQVAKLKELSADNPHAQQMLDEVRGEISESLGGWAATYLVAPAAPPTLEQLSEGRSRRREQADKLSSKIVKLGENENELLQERRSAQSFYTKLTSAAFGAAAFVGMVLLLGIFTLLMREIDLQLKAQGTIVHLHSGLEREAAKLKLVNKELETFSYSVSHDLRAPLRSIDGFSHALEEDYRDKLDDEGRDYLNRIRNAAQRMGALIDDMLELARVTRSEMHLGDVNLSAMAREIMGRIAIADGERRVRIQIEDGLHAWGDKALLAVAFENLLANAWKFSAKNPDALIEVGMAQRDGERTLFIRDNGAGFDMRYANKLFIPFQRLHAVTDFPGTGVGLATVQRIIHRHEGRIWADGEVNKGATFTFTLPMEADDA